MNYRQCWAADRSCFTSLRALRQSRRTILGAPSPSGRLSSRSRRDRKAARGRPSQPARNEFQAGLNEFQTERNEFQAQAERNPSWTERNPNPFSSVKSRLINELFPASSTIRPRCKQIDDRSGHGGMRLSENKIVYRTFLKVNSLSMSFRSWRRGGSRSSARARGVSRRGNVRAFSSPALAKRDAGRPRHWASTDAHLLTGHVVGRPRRRIAGGTGVTQRREAGPG